MGKTKLWVWDQRVDLCAQVAGCGLKSSQHSHDFPVLADDALPFPRESDVVIQDGLGERCEYEMSY